jgi:hypothetical protein
MTGAATPSITGLDKEEKDSFVPSTDDTASSIHNITTSPPSKPPPNDSQPTTVPLPQGEGDGKGDNTTPDATTSPPPEETRTPLQTTMILLALASALFLAALDVTIVTVAVPTIAQEFQSTAGYTWIGSAYMLATAAAAPMWGKISDIWGRKPIMLIAVAGL